MMRMKPYIYSLLIGLLAIGGFASCSESEGGEEEFADWQNRNDTYFANLYQLAQSNTQKYKVFRKWSLQESVATRPEDHIVVEVINEGSGSGSPLYTDSVRVHYAGRLMPSTNYPAGYLFEQTWTGAYNLATMKPVTMAVAGVVDGFTTALMHMHIGDRWRVYIPYRLAYDSQSAGDGVIPAYSTLIFDLTLDSYYRPDARTTHTKAKPAGIWIDE